MDPITLVGRDKIMANLFRRDREVIKKIFNENIELTVAGRTDAGVHAFGQVAHLI